MSFFSVSSFIVSYLPQTVFVLVFLCTLTVYAFRNLPLRLRFEKFLTMRGLARTMIYFRIIYAGILSTFQYFVWANGGGLGTFFLNAPLDATIPVSIFKYAPWIFSNSFGYFIFYSWGRFWLNALLSVLVAWAFYKLLIVFKRYNERFFEEGETELGYVTALLAGWPLIVIFVPIVFFCVVLISIFRLIFFRETLTTLGWPFLLSIFATAFIGSTLLTLLHWGVLKV